MTLNIARGIVYHKLSTDLVSLISSLYSPLGNAKYVSRLEEEFASYIGRKYAIAFPFARTAIYYSLKTQNFPLGSEIIMPPITIKGILDAVLDLGLKPVFVDLDLDTFCFDINKLEQAINKNTKSILITYLFGLIPNIHDLLDISRKNNLFVIEDFSQALNGKFRNQKMGSFGDVGVYSSSSIKTLDTYGGGLLVCDNDQLKKKLLKYQSDLQSPSRMHLINKVLTDLIRNLATSRFVFHFLTFPFIKIMSSLKPESMIKHTGEREKKMIDSLPKHWFHKYTSFQAKLGLKLLGKVNASDQKRLKNVEFIKSNIKTKIFPRGAINTQNIYWQLVGLIDDPACFSKAMQKKGVDTSTSSLEKISTLPEYPFQGDTPNADYLYNHGFFVPCYPGLSSKDLHHICNIVNSCIKS